MPAVLITGASRGIGLEFARQYAADGWHVVAACRKPAQAEELGKIAAGAADRVSLHPLDVLDHAGIDRLAGQLQSTPIDVLINNAGVGGTLTSVMGSIAQNNLGGMYGYRSTKAAANAVVKSWSIDLQRHGITAIALHPGWVRTDMGGARATLDVATSVAGMRKLIADLQREHSGHFLGFDGSEIAW